MGLLHTIFVLAHTVGDRPTARIVDGMVEQPSGTKRRSIYMHFLTYSFKLGKSITAREREKNEFLLKWHFK